jgi:hypothetical protein
VIFSLRNCKRATAECDRRVDSADLFGLVSRLVHSEFEIFTTHEETVREDVVSWVRLRQQSERANEREKNTRDGAWGFAEVGDHSHPVS